MKRLMTVCIVMILMIAGCGKKPKEDPSITPDTRESASITQIDFTQADAERLADKAVKEHCGKVACKVTSVRILGGDIAITYTYDTDSGEKSGDSRLYGVSVTPRDKTVYTASREEYKDNLPDIDDSSKEDSEKDPSDDSGKEGKDKDKKKGNYDLPDHVDENDEDVRNDEKVYDENGVQIWRIYTNKGRIEFSGTSSSKFNIQIMDLAQNVKGEPVDMKEAGEIEGSMKLDQGFYYIKIDASGEWSLYWNRIYE